MINIDKVKRQYDRWAGIYDRLWRRYIQKTVPRVAERIQQTVPRTVLDVGCGTGELERQLLESYVPQQVVGVDISEKMLEVARKKLSANPQMSFIEADAMSLPFENHRFDCVVSSSTFHYFPTPCAVVAEMRRVLKPNGRLIILDWCRDYLTFRVYDRVLRLFDPAYQHCYTLEEFRGLLEDADFLPIYGQRYRFDLIWGMMITDSIPRNQETGLTGQ